MKKIGFVLAMLALAFGLVFMSCDNDTTTSSGGTGGGDSGGAITITDIPQQHIGKYARMTIAVTVDGDWYTLFGGDFVTTTVGNIIRVEQRGILIRSSTVVIPLWYEYVDRDANTVKIVKFTGNGTDRGGRNDIGFSLWSTITGEEGSWLDTIWFSEPITFTNGNAATSFSSVY